MERWIARDRKLLVFSETVLTDSTSHKVLCEHVPEEVCQILERFSQLNQRRIFLMEFDRNVKKAVKISLLDVVKLYDAALLKYNSDIERLTSGMLK